MNLHSEKRIPNFHDSAFSLFCLAVNSFFLFCENSWNGEDLFSARDTKKNVSEKQKQSNTQKSYFTLQNNSSFQDL